MKDDFLSPTGNERTTEVKSRETIFYSEPKLDLSLLNKRGNSKTFSGWLIIEMKKARDNSNWEVASLMQSIYKKYKEFETSEKLILKGWKGKSSLEIIEKPDYFIVITFQKEDKNSKPKEIKSEITKEEINLIIKTISELNKGKKIPTRDIGEKAYKKKWDDIFSNRNVSSYGNHIKLNLILRLLDYYGMTQYRGRYSTVLKNCFNIQEVLTKK